MKKYRTGKRNVLIEEIEMIRESDSNIWFKDSRGIEDRCLKMSGNYQVWDSFQDAKDYLLKIQNNAIEKHSEHILRCQKAIVNINSLTP